MTAAELPHLLTHRRLAFLRQTRTHFFNTLLVCCIWAQPLPDETTTPAIVDAISSGRPQLVYTVGWLQPTKRWPSAELGLWLQWLLPSATWFWLMGSGSGKKKKKKKLS